MAAKKVLVFVIPASEDPNQIFRTEQAIAEVQEIMGQMGVRGPNALCSDDPTIVSAVEDALWRS